jgi:hypothetical protein
MPAPDTAPAVAGRSQLANKWALLVDTTPDTTPTWLPCFGISAFSPQRSYTTQDATDFDSDGWASTVQTQRGWSVTGTFQRKLYAGEEDEGQKFVRRASETATDVHLLYFDRYYGEESFEGYASPNWEPQGGGATDLESVNFTLNGQGALVPVTNPLWVPPEIDTALPAGQSVGEEITLKGTGFFGLVGASAVTIDGINATSYTVDSSRQLRAVIPVAATGASPVIVTNPWGAATPLSYTVV